MKEIAQWILNMEEEDMNFIKKFVLASGSLKEMAASYGVTYPTMRNRLDKIIEKIKASDTATDEKYVTLIKRLAMNDQIDFEAAAVLIEAYRKERKSYDK